MLLVLALLAVVAAAWALLALVVVPWVLLVVLFVVPLNEASPDASLEVAA